MKEELIIGIGLGETKFGIHEDELRALLGSPDNIDLHEYGDDCTREYNYIDRGISFSFSSEDDYKLTNIEIVRKGYEIEGIELIGMSLERVLHNLERFSYSKPAIDSISNEFEENHLMLYYKEEGLTISFIDYHCDSYSIGPKWKNEEEILWPPS
ncbi:MAG: hypothetical protein IPL46_10165 [Saprospiraceae bacterium]|nr:hypothetical protein [Saprospiraceae bacterium]